MGRDAEGGVIGLIPAAGRAARLGPIGASKEILPVKLPGTREGPTPACRLLLEKLRRGGVREAYIVLRPGKWDIPAELGDGGGTGVALAYLVTHRTQGPAFTIDQAYAFARGREVSLGFPDLLFKTEDPFTPLVARRRRVGAAVTLGLFPADTPATCDMVDVDADMRVRAIVVKPDRTQLKYTWGMAVWSAEFTEFLHEHVAHAASDGPELHIGSVIDAACRSGLSVVAVPVGDEPYLDIGTPENLARVSDR